MRDRSTGRLVAEPLRQGGKYCLFHTPPFSKRAVTANHNGDYSSAMVVVYLDLETTSLDVLSTEIVEIATVVDGTQQVFSSLVHSPKSLLGDTGAERIHGIKANELAHAPTFQTIMSRFQAFLRELSDPLQCYTCRGQDIQVFSRERW